VLAEFPETAKFLFRPAPYKVIHGGRGASKSWCIARALLILAARRKLYVLCAREIQKSIQESVHKLLSEQIEALGLSDFYTPQKAKIIGKNGAEFVFAGVRNNINAIRSMEGIDICWVEEAAFVTHNSWEVLLPTIRRDPPYGPFALGNEVWISFNPELATDDTYKRWVADPPAESIVAEMNWRDNPWFPQSLQRQKDDLKRRNYDDYLTVWEGKCRQVVEGAIYAKELRSALEQGRINPRVLYDRSKPVIVSFDLGRADMTSLWFWQQVGQEHRAIDFYENCGFGIDHYLEEIANRTDANGKRRNYLIGGIWLPHDAEATPQAARKSIKRQCQDVYQTPGIVRIVPRVKDPIRINAMRALFPRTLWNDQTCAGGLQCLQHYQYGVDPDTKQRTQSPLHNWASHAADSASYYAVMVREGNRHIVEDGAGDKQPGRAHAQGWMR
jgi:phage terminase large subunit